MSLAPRAMRGARALALLCLLATPASAAADELSDLTVSAPVRPGDFRGDLRELPVARPWQPGDPQGQGPRRIQTRPPSRRSVEPALAADPLLKAPRALSAPVMSRVFTTPTVNRDGSGYSGVAPPDTVGDIGPAHYVQAINDSAGTTILVLDKATGATAAGPFTLSTLFTGGGACTSGGGDPQVLFDQLAQRWLIVEFAATGNHLCMYVSKTSSPVSGGWWTYDYSTAQFPDYPKFGVWPDAWYATTNESSPAVYAFDRTTMLEGGAASYIRKTGTALSGFSFQAFTPADVDGAGLPPAGTPGLMLRHRDDEAHDASPNGSQDTIEVWAFSANFATPSASTFGKLADIAVSEFDSTLCGLSTMDCIPQPGTAQGLDPLREILMFRTQYRNFGSHQSIVGSFAVDVGGDHAGVRWFELRRTGTGAWSLHQEGTVAPDSAHRWNSSIAMDGSGNIALGYSVSGTSVYPGIRYIGRTSGAALGSMSTAETVIQAGSGSQSSMERWGDYSAMSVDPVDNCRFWYTNEYVGSNGAWKTRIASFRFDAPDCVDDAGGTCGNGVAESGEECDGGDDSACPGLCSGSCTCPAPVCGNEVVEKGEDCDGTSDASCPGLCSGSCTCPAPVCGNNVVESGEDCDGTSDAACPGLCTACACPATCDQTDLLIPSGKSDSWNWKWKILVDNRDGAWTGFDPRNGFQMTVTQGAAQVVTTLPLTGWDKSQPDKGRFQWVGSQDGVTKVRVQDKSLKTGYITVQVQGRSVPGAGDLDVIRYYANVELTMDGHCGGGIY